MVGLNTHHATGTELSVDGQQYISDTDNFEIEDVGEVEADDLELDLRDPETFPLILTSLWMNTALCALDGTIVSTTMNEIASRYQKASLVTWVATAYMLSTCSVQPLYGKISDIVGRRKCLLFAEIVFTVGIALCGLSSSLEGLIVARAISGIGGSGLGAMCNIILSDMAPLSERSVYMGWGSVIWGCAQSIGGPLGGALLTWFGIRGLFVVQLPFCLWSIYLTTKHIFDSPGVAKGSWRDIDFKGSIFLMGAIASFIFSCTVRGPANNTSLLFNQAFTIALTIAFSAGFIYVEKNNTKQSILPMSVLKGSLGLVGFIFGLSSMLGYVGLYIVPLYLQLVWGSSITKSGGYVVYAVISTSAGSFVCGWFLRKFTDASRQSTLNNAGLMLVFTTLIGVLGCSLMLKFLIQIEPGIGENQGISASQRFWFITGFIIMGLTQGCQSVSVMLYNVAKVGKKGQAASTSVTFLSRSLGNVLGVSLALGIFTSSLKRELNEFLAGDNPELYFKLIENSASVRTFLIPTQQMLQILLIFKDALVKAFLPCILCNILSVITAWSLYSVVVRSRRQKR
ncbi:LAMI_0F07778g1_1 [Lachancea mirantina]|uniref:LAMI_0F07778g1_1 n=1 Tax=Lachancea mirantina TaxID=1230905 RepID=A0A1G4JZW1_9SACH|nr:LAMI_0F07778g1_1 [Lachancea mirantina]